MLSILKMCFPGQTTPQIRGGVIYERCHGSSKDQVVTATSEHLERIQRPAGDKPSGFAHRPSPSSSGHGRRWPRVSALQSTEASPG